MKRNFFAHRISGGIILLTLLGISAAGQAGTTAAPNEEAINPLPFIMMLVIAVGLGLAYLFWSKSKKGTGQPEYNYDNRYKNYYNSDNYDLEGVDADREMEWLRKAKSSTGKSAKSKSARSRPSEQKATAPAETASAKPATHIPDLDFDTKIFQEKMRKLQYAQLPINSFSELSASKTYQPLPLSNDASLLNAIEQANEEFEEDETVRDLALRILMAFRTRNSVETLSQIALYDLSANLRSKAVTTLTDFDHESVFEAILLACADPTREVRAAAARGLFRLNFDRADAWKRLVETNDHFRMSHAARAAIESGIVIKSFDRLIHEDRKVAYEAFALVTMLIRSGETNELFEALQTHKDERVRFALLHVLKISREEATLAALEELQLDSSLPTDVAVRVRETIAGFETVTA